HPSRLPRLLPSFPTRRSSDLTCATVSAAAITAKVARDALMVELAKLHPDYGWDRNKGYGSAAHRAALAERGDTDYHRKSWNLVRSEEHTSELQSRFDLVCRLL